MKSWSKGFSEGLSFVSSAVVVSFCWFLSIVLLMEQEP
jgi:hypothetical protein